MPLPNKDHTWQDDALRRGATSCWQAGIAFTCTSCGAKRRTFEGGSFYVLDDKRLARQPECVTMLRAVRP